MSDDHTPTRDEIMYAWRQHRLNFEQFGRDNLGRSDEIRAELERFFVEHDRQLAAEAVSAGQAALIDWLIDVGYPFDFTFDSPPHIDGYDLARRWNERDGWDVSDEEAATLIFEVSGLVRYARPTALQGVQEESKA